MILARPSRCRDVLAALDLRESVACQRTQPNRIIQLPIREQTGVGGDLAAVEFQLQPLVEANPEGLLLRFTHHVPYSDPPKVAIMSVNPEYETYERDVEEVHIIGRVVWTARRL